MASKSDKNLEFSEKLLALKALKKLLTAESVKSAVANFQAIVHDQRRVGELSDIYQITQLEARIIMDHATISVEDKAGSKIIEAGQIWDRASNLASSYLSKDGPEDAELLSDISSLKAKVASNYVPTMLNDRAGMLATGVLAVQNSGKVGM